MRTTFIVLIVLVLCSIVSAQKLEVHGDNFTANTEMKFMAKELGL